MISVIIPTFNEADSIQQLIYHLQKCSQEPIEVIVTDGGSTDGTLRVAKDSGAICVVSPIKGRAAQMNFGAATATGDVFFFVHADTLPPASYVQDIERALANGFNAGRYRTRFNSTSLLLKLNAYFTRFNLFMCYGGDQTLFVTKALFDQVNGFDETKVIMEDYDLTERILHHGRYKIFDKPVLVSARKYEKNGWLTVQLANYAAITSYKKGVPTAQIAEMYKSKLRW